jgi:hypothetical protein
MKKFEGVGFLSDKNHQYNLIIFGNKMIIRSKLRRLIRR